MIIQHSQTNYCWPTGNHSDLHCWPPHQTHHPTIGQLVIIPTYSVDRPIRPTTPLSADWSSLQHTLLATPLSANWSSLQCTLLANPSAPPPHCLPTGHHPNQLVIIPTYPIGHPISPTTPLLANWSSLELATPTYPVGCPISSPTLLSANPLLAY